MNGWMNGFRSICWMQLLIAITERRRTLVWSRFETKQRWMSERWRRKERIRKEMKNMRREETDSEGDLSSPFSMSISVFIPMKRVYRTSPSRKRRESKVSSPFVLFVLLFFSSSLGTINFALLHHEQCVFDVFTCSAFFPRNLPFQDSVPKF